MMIGEVIGLLIGDSDLFYRAGYCIIYIFPLIVGLHVVPKYFELKGSVHYM
jgi:hypothetical protein